MVGIKTYAVTVPINEIKRLGWKKGDPLVVRRYKNSIIIEKEEP